MKITLIEAEPREGMDVEAAIRWVAAKLQNPEFRLSVIKFTLNGVPFVLDRTSKPDEVLKQYQAIVSNTERVVTG